MKKVLRTPIFIFLSCVALHSVAQSKFSDQVLENIVRQQFKNINMQSWVAMRADYADTMKVYSLGGHLIFKNVNETMDFFKKTHLKYPQSRSSIESMMTIGNKVIIKEKITDGDPNQPGEDVMIWEFNRDKKVAKVWLIF